MTEPEGLAELRLQRTAEALLNEYQALVDAKDIDGLACIVHPDVELTRRDGTRHGVESFLDLYREFAASDVDVAQHMVTNVVATPLPEETVRVDSRFFVITTHTAGGARLVWGSYRDHLVHHGGRWKLRAKRIAVVRTALLAESTLAPPDRDSFGELP